MTERPAPGQAAPARRRSRAALLWWRALALLAFVLGLIGALLPVMPTTPFLIVSAWAAGKGWPAFERWLLQHRWFGPHIVRWREHGAIPLRAKWIASTMMALSAIGLFLLHDIANWARFSAVGFMLLVALWLWTRPSS